MLGLVGSVPDEQRGLVVGRVSLEGEEIVVSGERFSVNRGTPAMIAAATSTLNYLGQPAPLAYLVGDIGTGDGCRELYKYLLEHIGDYVFKTLTLHYFQPDVKLFKQLLGKINSLVPRPTLIADAGFMYVAKMGADSSAFDLFTPDAGELAYLADEKAPHPFYTRGFILHDDNLVPELVARAYEHNNAATYLLVKGSTDYVANRGGILGTVSEPTEEAMEAIGGTGDTVTGIVSALIQSGLEIEEAAMIAAKVNRVAGSLAKPTPATQVSDIIKEIPAALEIVLNN